MPQQTCALRALSLDDQDGGCVAIPCLCELERLAEQLSEDVSRLEAATAAVRRSQRPQSPLSLPWT